METALPNSIPPGLLVPTVIVESKVPFSWEQAAAGAEAAAQTIALTMPTPTLGGYCTSE
jgi:hypothetical protein